MCGNATLAMEVSRTSMNVASVTVTAITQGLIEPSGIRNLARNLSFTLRPKILFAYASLVPYYAADAVVGCVSNYFVNAVATDRQSTRLNSSHIPLSRMP